MNFLKIKTLKLAKKQKIFSDSNYIYLKRVSFMVNKNVDFSHFVNFTLITDYHSVFKAILKWTMLYM